MIASAACIAGLTIMVRHASASLHTFEVVFWRNLFGLLIALPWAARGGLAGFATQRPGLHLARALTAFAGVVCWFAAIALMPVASATALSFTTPLFATAGAALVLKEAVAARRWAATAAGFAGTLIVLHPGAATFDAAAGLVLLSSAIFGAAILMVKDLARSENHAVALFYLLLVTTPLSAVPAAFVWSDPAWPGLGWAAAAAFLGNLGQITFYRALSHADASAVLPFEYTRLLFAALLGFLFFDEQPDLWTWLGGTVIFAATVYGARSMTIGEKERR